MLCPMKFPAFKPADLSPKEDILRDRYLSCVEDKCAWWESGKQQCVVANIAFSLDDMFYSLRGIANVQHSNNRL